MKVLAFTAVGDGTVSAPLICSTDEDIAEMPSKVTVVPSSIDSLIVNWLPNRRTTGRLIHFTVYSKEVERGEDVNAQKWTVNPQLNRLEIRNLRRRTVFYFQVAASTQAGYFQLYSLLLSCEPYMAPVWLPSIFCLFVKFVFSRCLSMQS